MLLVCNTYFRLSVFLAPNSNRSASAPSSASHPELPFDRPIPDPNFLSSMSLPDPSVPTPPKEKKKILKRPKSRFRSLDKADSDTESSSDDGDMPAVPAASDLFASMSLPDPVGGVQG